MNPSRGLNRSWLTDVPHRDLCSESWLPEEGACQTLPGQAGPASEPAEADVMACETGNFSSSTLAAFGGILQSLVSLGKSAEMLEPYKQAAQLALACKPCESRQ